MFGLTSILYSLIATTLAGNFVLICLTVGCATVVGMITAALAGSVLALPLAILMANELRPNC